MPDDNKLDENKRAEEQRKAEAAGRSRTASARSVELDENEGRPSHSPDPSAARQPEQLGRQAGRATENIGENLQRGAQKISDNVQQGTEELSQHAQSATRRSLEFGRRANESGISVIQQAGQEWVAFGEHSARLMADAVQTLWKARNLRDILGVQTRIATEIFQEGVASGARISAASIHQATELLQSVIQSTEQQRHEAESRSGTQQRDQPSR